jgi:putative acetyltransferase
MPAITLRPYHASDATSLVDLFRASVRSIAARDYRPSQIRAWAPDNLDEEKFGQRCAAKTTWIAEIDHRIAGFSDLEPDGHIDMLYVHPNFQRRGVARTLLDHIEKTARALDLHRLYTEANITARPVFEAFGFHVVVPQTVTLRGQSLTNYRMQKQLQTP